MTSLPSPRLVGMATTADDGDPQAGELATDAAPAVADLSYEEARDELIEIVSRLEGGQLGLEESMSLWQRGEALAARCSTWLDHAESSLTKDEPQP